MSDYQISLLEQYSPSGILVDSNLLLLWFVGLYDLGQISNSSAFRRIREFVIDDYLTLITILERFRTFLTTPNILTEVSNLSNQMPNNLKPGFFAVFAHQLTLMTELYLPSRNISVAPDFALFGLTDAGILSLTPDQYLVLTVDLRLAVRLQELGVDAINFNHFRTYL